jgi:hypothetical protein
VGDSRRTLDHAVLPHTTDLVWAQMLGMPGGPAVDGMRQVRYLAEPGVVHEHFTSELRTLLAGCTRGERPLVFDFMGTNYAVQHPDRVGDPAFYDDIRDSILRFYGTASPTARVVLAELTLQRDSGDATTDAGVAFYLDRYNAVLRDLARTRPSRFFFLPAPGAYEHSIRWRDTAHETASSPMVEYQSGTPSGALDAAGLAVVDDAGGDVCALAADPRFGAEAYSEGVSLMAYLQDFRRSPAARRWLDGTHRSATRGFATLRRAPCRL